MPVVVITGANRGIGLALAKAYVGVGWTVIATARAPAQATALQALAQGGRVEIVPLDVTNASSTDAFGTALGTRRIDVAILNSGIYGGARGGLEDADNTAELWAQVLATNVTGVMLSARAVLPAITRAKGKIAIIASRMGSSAAASGSSYLYRCSKAAAANLGANLAIELKPKGVAVAVYHPGWVRTDMGGPGADLAVEESAEGLLRRIDALTLERSGVFEDYAGQPIAY
jgi:NAD(P)-dependent dehydrogenase (short-subunit alcohol dehydrogenase family)